MQDTWQFWIDRGGTFTDIVARHPCGRLSAHKYLSDNPELYTDAAVHGMRMVMEVPSDAPFPTDRVSAIKMGTTVATNALLERGGSKTLLVITGGLRDALLIGQQHRPDLFALVPQRPPHLYSDTVEARERLAADGEVILPIDLDDLRHQLTAARECGYASVAIAFAHAYRNPVHEIAAGRLAADIGFTQISLSHDMSATIKLVPRGDTAVADAYLSPVLRHYVDQVARQTGGAPLYFMTSSGGLTRASTFQGRHAVLSGPAGGIVGCAAMGARAGRNQIIGFDMGGTSTDVSHYSGDFERRSETEIAGVRFSVPMLDIHTVAAGGGSVCRVEDGRLLVGPESAGANPGPAAYGRGGPITITDCNVALGKLQPDLFPAVFGPDGTAPIDRGAALAGLDALAADLATQTGIQMDARAVAEGFLNVAVEHMARAIKRISVERGHNIKDYSLLSFGGAGGQHACPVADALGMTSVIIPPFSGVLSALGMGLAVQNIVLETSVGCPLDDTQSIKLYESELIKKLESKLAEAGQLPEDLQPVITAYIKTVGSDTPLAVRRADTAQMQTDFHRLHRTHFGFTADGPLHLHSLGAEVRFGGDPHALDGLHIPDRGHAQPVGTISTYIAGDVITAPVFKRDHIGTGTDVTGPALITENGTTVFVDLGWCAICQADGSLHLTREHTAKRQNQSQNIPHQESTKIVDPILLEVFNNLFMSVAEQMGGVLAKTAHSVNVKERLDFSCAVFDAAGGLVANAPHMPVHLGSMGSSVAAVLDRHRGRIAPGDAFLVNDPFAGGTHLPDLTVISPVFLEGSDTPDYFTASRGHHADIGGISPGSMPPFSRTLVEEGVKFTGEQIVRRGRFLENAIVQTLTSGPYPARQPDQNIADLKAQIAANARGHSQIVALTKRFGPETVSAYMGHVKDNARAAVMRLIDRLQDGQCHYPMDCGGWIAVRITVNRAARTADIDFTGTAPQQDSNFNAPVAVTRAAVLYVFRLLTNSNIPLNDGCLDPLNIIIPAGSMLNPGEGAAVVAGNVEVSQAVVNALLMATGAAASSQGTMNNLIFGDDHRQYYETLAGGIGGADGQPGRDPLQSHMTNSRLTDIEVLERRYPVRVHDFRVRTGSGGSGAYPGGCGLIRDIAFLAPMDVSVLASHRKAGPPGLAGGGAGTAGRNLHIHADGSETVLAPSDFVAVAAGDRIRIETPGGGGYGHPETDTDANKDTHTVNTVNTLDPARTQDQKDTKDR